MIETYDYWISDDAFIFKHHFNEPIDKYANLIADKKKLIFSNYTLFDLSVKIYDFNDYYNKYLFSYYYKKSKYNQPLIVNLNSNLEYLIFSYYFNNLICLPNSLIFLIIGKCFNQSIELPESLQYLELNQFANYNLILPNLKFLSINSNDTSLINNLPHSLQTLKLNKNFDLDLNDLPSGITEIIFCQFSKYNKPLNNLPNSLEKLILPKKYNMEIKNIPPKLKLN